MKFRNGFVSNSSSSSFLILKKNITETQIQMLLEENDKQPLEDQWSITIEEEYVYGDCWMDNFLLTDYLEKIGVKSSNVLCYERKR